MFAFLKILWKRKNWIDLNHLVPRFRELIREFSHIPIDAYWLLAHVNFNLVKKGSTVQLRHSWLSLAASPGKA